MSKTYLSCTFTKKKKIAKSLVVLIVDSPWGVCTCVRSSGGNTIVLEGLSVKGGRAKVGVMGYRAGFIKKKSKQNKTQAASQM